MVCSRQPAMALLCWHVMALLCSYEVVGAPPSSLQKMRKRRQDPLGAPLAVRGALHDWRCALHPSPAIASGTPRDRICVGQATPRASHDIGG